MWWFFPVFMLPNTQGKNLVGKLMIEDTTYSFPPLFIYIPITFYH